MENQNSKKFLCLEVSKSVKDSVTSCLIPELCKCPANPEMLMAALQFITDDMVIKVRISDEPINFFDNSSIK